MGRKKKESILPKELIISEEEQNMRALFDFAYWLENLPGKKGLDGAIALLRMFLGERKLK